MRIKTFILVAAGLLSACATFPPTESAGHDRQGLPYDITVRPLGPANVSAEGFEARFDFLVTSPLDLERNALVQELRQVMTLTHADGSEDSRHLSLVEAFRLQLTAVNRQGMHEYGLMPGQRDRHTATLNDVPADVVLIRIERTVSAYVANVAGADFSELGFAHLPENEDGSLVSNVGRGFNADYQAAHETRGSVAQSAPAFGTSYRMLYTLRRGARGMTQFVVDYGGAGSGSPAQVLGDSR